MIRHELKIDPIGYIGKNLLDGAQLTHIERLYVINKCPHLFSHINNTTKWDEKLYLNKMRWNAKEIDIHALKYRNNVKKALKMSPSLCAKLNFNQYKQEVNHSIGKIKTNDTPAFTAILENPTVDKDLTRKVLMFRPDLIHYVKDIKMFNDDYDLQIFVFKCNPLLISSFESISNSTVLYMINEKASNVKYLSSDALDKVDSEILSKLLNEYVILIGERSYDVNIVTALINNRQEIFTDLIRTLSNYDGFSPIVTDIIIKRLLREFNNMIDDDVAEIVIRGKM